MDTKPAQYVNGCVLVATGILFFVVTTHIGAPMALLLGLLLSAYGAVRVAFFYMGRANGSNETTASLVGSAFTLLLGVFLIVSPNITLSVLSKAVPAWLIVTGLIYLLITYTYIKGKDRGWVSMLAAALAVIVLGIFLWSYLFLWDIAIGFVIPIYLVAAGLYDLINWSVFSGHKGVHFALPMLVQAFMPQRTLARIKETKSAAGADGKYKRPAVAVKTEEADRGMEVLIHMSDQFEHSFGHVDIAFGDKVFSYGNFDHSKDAVHIPILLYDGIFIICPREAYLNFAVTESGETIFGYRLAPDQSQKDTFERNVEDFLRYCIPWEPAESDREINAYPWALKEMGARLYKVEEGRFKTYFPLNNNCALLSEELLEGMGIPHARSVGGFVTPGSVLSLYENELAKADGIVVFKREYAGSRQLAQ